jgi:hypothetical protein
MLETELSRVERRRTPENPFWTNMSAENIITELMATPKGARIDRFSADMEQIINENGIREYPRVLLETRMRNCHDSNEHQNKTCRTDTDIPCYSGGC